MPRIFVSHSSLDNDACQTFVGWLKDHGFDEIFLDFDRHHGIPPGDDWEKRLYGEIQRATAVTLLLTKNWFDSKWCFAEFTQARALGKSILPVVVAPDGNQFIGDNLQKISLVPDRNEGLSRLLDRLHDIAMDGPAGFSLPPGRAPFPGMLSFDRDDAAVYFGRGPEVRESLEQLERLRRRGGAKLLYLHGDSGAGKSSLLKAGLLPHLERRASDWIVVPPFRPGANPLSELRGALLTAVPTLDASLIDALFESPDPKTAASLVDALHRARGEYQATILLCIDQLEEMSALATGEQQHKLVSVLTALLDPSLKTLGVATLRTADLPAVESQLGIASEQRLLGPFPLDRVPEIVRKPAQVAGLQVDDGLVAALVRDATSTDALPLVAFLLRRLYDRHGADYKFNLAEYEALGDVSAGLRPLETCVRDAAAEAIRRVGPSPAEEAALRETFVPGLVRINDRGQFVRKSLPAGEVPEEARRLVEALVDERLLVRRDGSLEVAHEALFRVWPPLAGWLEEEREFLVALTRLEAAVADWRQAAPERQDDTLLTGLMLSRCEGWLAQFPKRFSGEQRRFIETSSAARIASAERKRRLQRLIVGASLAAAGIFAVLGGVAWHQRTEAKAATAAAKQQAYFASISLASDRLERGQLREARAILNEAPAEWRNWEWSFLQAQSDNSIAVLRGHEDSVESAAFSPDGAQVVTTDEGNTARVWDAVTGDEVAKFHDRNIHIVDATFTPDGPRIISASHGDVTARVWDAVNGIEIAVLRGHEGRIHSAAFSPDGARIVTTSNDGTARAWDAATGHEVVVLRGNEAGLTAARFSPDGTRIFAFSDARTVRVWDAASGKELAVVGDNRDRLVRAALSPDNARMVTWGSNYLARVWDAGNGTELAVLHHEGSVNSVAFSPDGGRIVTASRGLARLWDSSTGNLIDVLGGYERRVSSAAFSTDGARILTTSGDNTLRVWDSASGEEIAVLRGHEGGHSAAFSQNGARIIIASANTARVWDGATGEGVAVLHHGGDAVKVNSAVFNPDGTRIVTAAGDNRARVWDAKTGDELTALRGHLGGDVNSAVFSPDGRWIVTASANTARVWDATTGDEITALRGHEREVIWAAFSPDGARVITASTDNTVRTWDAATGKEVAVLRGHKLTVGSLAMSPDGARIVTASSGNTARLLDTTSGNEVAVLSGDDNAFDSGGESISSVKDGKLITVTRPTYGVKSAAFSPDGTRIATVSEDPIARVWDTATGREVTVLRGHESSIKSIAFSPDGTRIVTASFDRTARVWDTSTGREVAILRGHGHTILSAAFSFDGTRIVTASEDKTVRVWDSIPYAERFKERLRLAAEESP